MNEIDDKLLIEMYRNTTSKSTKAKVKQELIARGYRFAVKENWKPSWQMITGGSVGVLLLILLAAALFFKTPPDNKMDQLITAQQTTIQALLTEIGGMKCQLETLSKDHKSLQEKAQQMSSRLTTTNDRLWRFGVMNQENWVRIQQGEKEMVLMNADWYPDKKLTHLHPDVNARVHERKAILESEEDFTVPQPVE